MGCITMGTESGIAPDAYTGSRANTYHDSLAVFGQSAGNYVSPNIGNVANTMDYY